METEIDEVKMEEAKWAKDVMIERSHELQEERDMLAVLHMKPSLLAMADGIDAIKELEGDDSSSLKTDSDLPIESSI